METGGHVRRLSDRELVAKFSLLVGLAAIFVDAVIAHGLFWDNDPYWTYWITKTFLITTVFAVGTSLLGIGIWQGFFITAVHTVILTAYYDWFAPVGLPQEPEWLDMEHLWITGVPAHFLAILAGYLAALWMWRRNDMPDALNTKDARGNLWMALFGSLLVLVLDGLITHGLITKQFPGWTYFVQHLLITFVFLLAWGAWVGFDLIGWMAGSIVLALLWLGYAMYLGPTGLPQEVRYLGYEDLWMKAFPGALIASLLGLFVASKSLKATPRPITLAAAVLLTLQISGPAHAQGLKASATAAGPCAQIVGPDPINMESSIAGSGTIRIDTTEKGNRWSHVQNTDEMNVRASWTANGSNWEVTIDKAMPRHPLGKYTVWNGVVYGHEMHGHTGIGTGKLPLMKPQIALWGWASVKRDGEEIARMAPAHVMVTTEGQMKGVMLEVDTEEKALVGVPDGYLTVMWHEIGSLSMPDTQENQRKTIGWFSLVVLPLVLLWLIRRERQNQEAQIAKSNDF